MYNKPNTTRKFKTHNIADLIDYLDSFDKNFIDDYIDLVKMADEITTWEASFAKSCNFTEPVIAKKPHICVASLFRTSSYAF